MEEWADMSFKAKLSPKIRGILSGERIVAAACSGGVDSMVLTVILAEVCSEMGVPLKVFIVEHGLRESSKAHALGTLEELQKRHIDAEILHWKHDDLASKIEESARYARYALMWAKIREYGVSKLFLGHHMNDNIETFFQRLAKKSDIFGLSCMSEASQNGLIRPMLGFSKSEIIEYAAQNNIVYFEDETNASAEFSRNKLRKNLPEALRLLEIKPEDVSGTIEKISGFKTAFEGFSTRVFAQTIIFNAELGIFESTTQKLEEFKDDELLYFFRILIGYFDSSCVHFRYDELRTAVQNLRTKKSFTIGKMEVFWSKSSVFFIKQAKYIENAVKDGVWDQRFYIESPQKFEVKTMSRASMEKIIEKKIYIPEKIFRTLPIIFDEEDELLAFPAYIQGKVRIKGLEPSHPFNKA